MPRQRRRATPRKQAPLGPYDLSTRLLPGGTEIEALGTGFSLARANLLGYSAGYAYAAKLANENILKDATKQQSFVIADVKTGILRSQNAPQLFTEFRQEMIETFTRIGESDITADDFARGHAWNHAIGAARNAPLRGPLSAVGQNYVKIKDGVFLHHRSERTVYPSSPQKVHPHFRIAY